MLARSRPSALQKWTQATCRAWRSRPSPSGSSSSNRGALPRAGQCVHASHAGVFRAPGSRTADGKPAPLPDARASPRCLRRCVKAHVCVCVCVCACVCTRVRTIQAKLGVKHDGDRDQGDGRDRQRGMGPFRDTAPRNLDGYHRPRPASTDLPGAALMQRARARRGSSRALCARRIGTRLSTEGSPCPRLSERSFAPCSSRVELISGAHVRSQKG